MKSSERDIHELLTQLPNDQGIESRYKRALAEGERKGRQMLADPILFADEMDGRDDDLNNVLISSVAVREELLSIWWTVLRLLAEQESKKPMLNALAHFQDFVTDHYVTGVRKGVHLGALIEQYRTGLNRVKDELDRPIDWHDEHEIGKLMEICEDAGIVAPKVTIPTVAPTAAD